MPWILQQFSSLQPRTAHAHLLLHPWTSGRPPEQGHHHSSIANTICTQRMPKWAPTNCWSWQKEGPVLIVLVTGPPLVTYWYSHYRQLHQSRHVQSLQIRTTVDRHTPEIHRPSSNRVSHWLMAWC